MSKFEICELSDIVEGIQTLKFKHINTKPRDPLPPNALMKRRKIIRPMEISAYVENEITGEMDIPIYKQVEDKYIKWENNGFVAMTPSEKVSIDTHTQNAHIEDNREKWTFHNKFITLCDTLADTTDHIKLSDTEVMDKLTELASSNSTQALVSSMMGQFLLMRQQGVQRYGNGWWYDVQWHSEIL